MLLALWFAYGSPWYGDTPEVATTRGGIADYRKYQKKLRKIAKAADERLYKKARKQIEALQQEELPAAVEKQVAAISVDLSKVLDTAASSQHELIAQQIKKLDLLIEQIIVEQHKREEEIILFLLMA
jgi:hypothetical protein